MLDQPIARIENLRVEFQTKDGPVVGVEDVSFNVNPGETVCIVGESGSGKSVSSLSLMRLVEFGGGEIAGGRLIFDRKDGEELDLSKTDQNLMRTIRGNEIGMIFQEPMTALNPVFTVGRQLTEGLRLHKGMTRDEAEARALELLKQVRIPEPERRLKQYPHELSGGMRQRVVIAMALACEPRLLIADEPTTALDVTIQAEILALMDRLKRETGTAVMFITHDMAVVAQMADRVVVMFRGNKVEEGTVEQIFENPQHDYTKALLAAVPKLGEMTGKPLPEPMKLLGREQGEIKPIPGTDEPLLTVKNLVTRFAVKGGFFRRTIANVHAVEDVSFTLNKGRTLSLVGESGCGKSTCGRSILRLVEPMSGQIDLDGTDIMALDHGQLRDARRDMQMIFQDPFASLNPQMQLGAAVEDATYMVFEGIWYALTYVISAALILSSVDPLLALPLLGWVALYVLYVRYIAVRVAVASEKWSGARSMVTARVVDAYTNIETVKLFADAGTEERYVLSAMKRLRLRFQRFLRLMTELSFGLNVVNGVLILGMMTPAIWLWSRGTVSVGEVAAASALTIRLNGMSGWIMWVTVRLFEHAGVIREGLQSVSVPHEVTDAPDAPKLQVTDARIEFKDISHHYGKGKGGLDHISLTVEPGQKVGLVGRSGAGKSSLVNLLLRFHDPESGRVLIDGQDIRDVTQVSLRREIGMVSQDNSLLHRSIRGNILYGRSDASDAQMIEAAKQAEAHEFIQTLADPKGRTGYNAHVGERGVKLSGGQRQRITIARVILKDAPILVLDEATSALDSEVEAAIQQTLFGLMQGKTVIAIAHRLSTIAQMDRIVVMDKGRVIEDGSHADLLARGGVYAGLWERQSGGFLGDDEETGKEPALGLDVPADSA